MQPLSGARRRAQAQPTRLKADGVNAELNAEAAGPESQRLWSAGTCPRFEQATCRRQTGRGVELGEPLNAALLGRLVGQATKAVTSHRTPNPRARTFVSIDVSRLRDKAPVPRELAHDPRSERGHPARSSLGGNSQATWRTKPLRPGRPRSVWIADPPC